MGTLLVTLVEIVLQGCCFRMNMIHSLIFFKSIFCVTQNMCLKLLRMFPNVIRAIFLCNQRSIVSRLLTVCGLWPWNRMKLIGHRGIK